MKLGFGHGPRFHLNLFSPRCRWPCISHTASTIGSNSTNSSLLDNDHTSSWTYIHYHNNARDSDPGSTLNDMELISLINQGSVFDDNVNDESDTSIEDHQWLNSSDRHARRDVRTLFPENQSNDDNAAQLYTENGGRTSEPNNINLSQENVYVNLAAAAAASARCAGQQPTEAQYMNLPFARECVPVYSASNGSNRSSSSHGRQSLSSALFDDSEDMFPGGDHPYGIPSSLLGGVLLNLDNQFRLSANSEWENWSEFLTDNDHDATNRRNNNHAESSESEGRETSRVSSGSSNLGAASEMHFNNEISSDTPESDQSEDANHNRVPHNTPNLIGTSSFPLGRIALPPPPSSNSSTRSSRSSSGPQQQDWYFYDPRLVPESRTERVTLDTSFRGLHNRCHMSSIIQPPSYEELMNETTGVGGARLLGEGPVVGPFDGTLGPIIDADIMDFDPPPPYTDSGPPPSYDQTFGHTLAFPTFNLGLPVNPLERRLAASLCTTGPIFTPSSAPDPDLLMDVNIDELLEGTSPAPVDMQEDCSDGDSLIDDTDSLGVDEDDLPAPDNANYEDGSRLEDNDENGDDEDLNNNFSPRRYPIGFCLGRRPPLRWSRGMSPNQWTSTENWALQ